MLYNYDYKLPVIVSTYKSNYGKGRTDIIDHNVEFLDIQNYSLYMINKTIKLYDKIIYELHEVSFYNLTPMNEKVESYRKIIMDNLNLILGKFPETDLELITIEHYFMDRREKLLIVKETKVFEQKMRKLIRQAREKKQFRNKKVESN